MSGLELAECYMDCFYGRRPLSAMADLLVDDLVFKGPLVEFSSAKDYMASLMADPPESVDYEMIHVFEKDNVVCLVYNFKKQKLETPMAQIFETRDNRISKITLIFDTAGFL